jgi:hypothetical protein
MIAVTATLWGAGACGTEKPVPPSDCPNLSITCPSPAPSYVTDVAPLLFGFCGACHTEGGVEAFRSYDTYDQVKLQVTHIQFQVYSCMMPPAAQPQPTFDQRLLILDWIRCGSPDN